MTSATILRVIPAPRTPHPGPHPVTRRERTWIEVLVTATVLAFALVGVVKTLTHVVAPRLLTHYEQFPALADAPKRTRNQKGTPADPVNLAFVGARAEIATAMQLIGWVPADSLDRAADIAIAKSVLLNRPDSSAPVSSLYLFGRKQDVAFEQQVGPSARRRHHVRLWLDQGVTYHGRPVWLAGATYDMSAGMSHRALRPTHHIAPDIDQERDGLEALLAQRGQAAETFRVTGMGVRVDDHNAEGDRFDTDGELRVVVIPPGNVPQPAPVDPGVPFAVGLKDRIWSWAHRSADGRESHMTGLHARHRARSIAACTFTMFLGACSHAAPNVVPEPSLAGRDEPRELAVDQQAKHALERLTYGPRPGEAANVLREGLDHWLIRQLTPENWPDHAADSALVSFPVLSMSVKQLVDSSPQQDVFVRRRRAELGLAPNAPYVMTADDSAASRP